MKKLTLLATILVALTVSVMTASVFAQPQGQPAAQQKPLMPFMIVDLAAIMEAHPALQAEAKGLDAQASATEQKILNDRKTLQQTYDDAKKMLNPSSAEFAQATEQFQKKMMSSEVDARMEIEKMKRTDLELQYKYFAEIRQFIADFAKYNNVGVVFLYRSPVNALNAMENQLKTASATNPNTPKTVPVEAKMSVEIGLNNQGGNAIYVNPQFDMTASIMQMVAQKYPNAAPGGTSNMARPNQPVAPTR